MTEDRSSNTSKEGIIEIEGQGMLPKEFLTIGNTFEEALGRCTLLDDRQKNAVIIYKAQMDMFNMRTEISDLTNWLNASSAVGGYNKALAAMTYTQIFVPSAAGVKLTKESHKELEDAQRRANHRNREDQQTNE